MWALNLMKYREVADYADGRESNLTGQEADDAYAPLGPLAAVGARVVFVGQVAGQLRGDDTEWDRIGVVLYPRRRALIEMNQREDFQELHAHKDAGMERTIVVASFPSKGEPLPMDVPSAVGTDQRVLLQVVADASADDLASGIEATRIARFDIEGWILGDNREWAEARWDLISRETAEALVASESAADSAGYTVVLTPTIDTIAASVVEPLPA